MGALTYTDKVREDFNRLAVLSEGSGWHHNSHYHPFYERFRAHLTLAMANVPERFFEEVLAFVREADPIGPSSFLAETVQLLAFHSEDWEGRWWETLRWRLLRSWPLAAR